MNAYQLSAWQQNKINTQLDDGTYEKLDSLMKAYFNANPLPEPNTKRAYMVNTRSGRPGFRINAVGAIRRLQDNGVNWHNKLGLSMKLSIKDK